MLQKVIHKEDGLQKANGGANAKARCRMGVLCSSDDDCCCGSNFDTKNHLDKVEANASATGMQTTL